MKTIGHHTCSKKNGREYVEKNAPFHSIHDETNNALKFLGSGYYFWDDNIEMAHYWGHMHFHCNYYIMECQLHLESDIFLDLVGNRSHLRYFKQLIQKFEEYGFSRSKWTIGAFIEFLKSKEKDMPGIFPFKAIRAIDNSVAPKNKNTIQFVDNKPNYTNLDPRLVICLIEKNDVILHSKKIV
jgi:hypothetical protein